jgi:hypothetical protein
VIIVLHNPHVDQGILVPSERIFPSALRGGDTGESRTDPPGQPERRSSQLRTFAWGILESDSPELIKVLIPFI